MICTSKTEEKKRQEDVREKGRGRRRDGKENPDGEEKREETGNLASHRFYA